MGFPIARPDPAVQRLITNAGCPRCGVLPLSGVYVCEHGVTPGLPRDVEVSATITYEDRALHERLLRLAPAPPDQP